MRAYNMPYKTFQPPTEWTPPDTFPAKKLLEADEIAIDLETRDPNLRKKVLVILEVTERSLAYLSLAMGTQTISLLPMKPALIFLRKES